MKQHRILANQKADKIGRVEHNFGASKKHNACSCIAMAALRDFGHDTSTAFDLFDKSLDQFKGRLRCHFEFCGALSTVFASTATVEADFSMHQLKQRASRSCLADFSLEGVLQTMQYMGLRLLT